MRLFVMEIARKQQNSRRKLLQLAYLEQRPRLFVESLGVQSRSQWVTMGDNYHS